MQAVIMAAGQSSRFWPLNEQHKTLFKICGRPLLAYLVSDLRQLGIKDIVIVQGPRRDVEKTLRDPLLQYAVQEKPTGTGDALLAAEKFIREEQFFLFNADDTDVKKHIVPVLSEYRQGKSQLVLLASQTKTPWLFGVLKVEKGRVKEIVEKPVLGQEPSNLKNDNFFFLPREFFRYLKGVPSGDFSLIQALNAYTKEKPVQVVLSKEKTLSLKLPWHLLSVLFFRLNSPGFKAGIASNVILARNVSLSGKVFIGEKTKIGSNTVIQGPCHIGSHCEIGPNNVLRGPLNLENEVKTGAFMEIKNSAIGAGTHFHSGYLGDSLVGENCRFGAGLVAANRRLDRKNIFSNVKGRETDTGLSCFGTVVGNNVRVGVQVGIMPGVFLGKSCLVGPAAIVFENVPDSTKLVTKTQTQILKTKNGNRKG